MIDDDGMLGIPSDTDDTLIAPDSVMIDTRAILAPVMLTGDTSEMLGTNRKRGRPSKKSLALTQDGDSVLQEMIKEYEEGASDPEVCKILRLPYSEFKKKLNNDQDFKILVEYGRMAAQAFWYQRGRMGMLKKGTIDYQFWQLWMKNQYGWTEKAATTNPDERPKGALSLPELREAIKQKKAKFKDLLGDDAIDMEALEYGSS